MPGFSALGQMNIQLTAPLAKTDFSNAIIAPSSRLQQVFFAPFANKACTT